MKKILTFGELLIRYQTITSTYFSKSESNITSFIGGSETNVAVTLSQLGINSQLFTHLPDNAITSEIISNLEKLNVDTSKIKIQGDRIGQYTLLSANGLTNGEVIYDRKYSSFYQLELNDLNWDEIFEDCSWLHWTAITPALSENLALITKQALIEANKRNIKISVDLNYRNKLWQYGKNPIEIMPELVEFCDVIMGNIWAENKMLGTSIDDSLIRSTSKEIYVNYSEKVAKEIFEKFPKCKHVANTLRFMDNPNHNLFYGIYHTDNLTTFSDTFETSEIIDRIGSGDAFMGGLIYALVNDFDEQKIVDTATKAGFQKLFVKGDLGNGKLEK